VADETHTALVLDECDLAESGYCLVAVPLRQGKVLVPLTGAVWDCIGDALASVHPDVAGELGYFVAAVMRCAGFGTGFAGGIAILEVQVDRQSAIVASDGAVSGSFVWDLSDGDGPLDASEGPVNLSLRALGVDRGESPDECSAIGLDFSFTP
jgi:hypothetical protein